MGDHDYIPISRSKRIQESAGTTLDIEEALPAGRSSGEHVRPQRFPFRIRHVTAFPLPAFLFARESGIDERDP